MQHTSDDRYQGLRDIEARLIGSVLLDGRLFDRVSEQITAKDFSRPLFARAWEAFNTLSAEQTPIDLTTVSHALDGAGIDYDLSGLAEAAKHTATPGNIAAYAEIVTTHSEGRRLETLLSRYQQFAEQHHQLARPPKEIASELEMELAQFSDFSAAHIDTPSAAQSLAERARAIAMGERTGTPGIDLGLPRINACTGGGKPKEMSVLAGRPSHGKTAYALRVAARNSLYAANPKPTLIFSIEMPQDDLLCRLIAMITGLPFVVVNDPSPEMLAKHELSRDVVIASIDQATKRIQQSPLHIEECAHPQSQRASGILTMAKRWRAHYGSLGLIVVDYLQLMECEAHMMRASDEAVTSYNSRSMKKMAKQLDTHVMLLSQLNRNLEHADRVDKRPRLSDLRGSGSIEQDADVIAFVYQDQLYHPDTLAKDQMELIVGKVRNGPLTKTRARLEMACSRLHAYTPEEEQAIEASLAQAAQNSKASSRSPKKRAR